jgi:hypothetical protein
MQEPRNFISSKLITKKFSSLCKMSIILQYLCAMQIEITSQDKFPEANEENLKAVVRRREEYSLTRDLRAKEDNEAIARRLAKEKDREKEKQE